MNQMQFRSKYKERKEVHINSFGSACLFGSFLFGGVETG